MNIQSFRASLLIAGLSGIVAQIVLLRELLISFLGNELTLGMILANWLFLVAISALITGKTVEKAQKRMEVFVSFQLFFSVALPLVVFLSRTFRNILLATPGEGLGFVPIFYSSFLILLPVTLPLGGLFTYGCKLYFQTIQEDPSSVGHVYVFESTGAMAGGLLMTFLMIPYLNSFQTVFIISLANALISAILVWPPLRGSHRPFKTGLWTISCLLFLVFAYCLLPQVSNSIQQSSIRSQWRNLHVLHNENSIYGNITVTRRGEQFTFFTDGVPSITTPVPDIASVEDFVHFPMLFHEKPESALILSGGVGGMIHELLKYPVLRVDYVELDPLLLKLVQTFPTPLTQSELSDQRVRIHYMDGRCFVKKTRDRFDIIFLGLPAPQELQTNRLFSSEFFSVAKERMNPDGIIALTIPGSLTYISPPLRDLNGCILDTLKNVYRFVRVIPGDVNLYLASDSSPLEKVTSDEIMKRLEERKIKTSLFTRGYVDYRLHERWTEWFSKSIGRETTQINSDFRPLAVFLSLSYWNALFSPSLAGIFKRLEGFSLQQFIVFTVFFTLAMGILFIKKPRLARQSVPYAIFATGWAGMTFNLAIIFTFQTFYGFLYHQIGLLVAILMSGVALGSLLVTQHLDKIRKHSLLFLEMEMGIILFSFLFPFTFITLSQYLERTSASDLTYVTFLIMSFLSGAWIGLQFPLATKIYLAAASKAGTLGHTAGLIYGADLLGGFLGGLFGGILLLPVLGLKDSCFMMAIIKISSGLLFLLFMKIQNIK